MFFESFPCISLYQSECLCHTHININTNTHTHTHTHKQTDIDFVDVTVCQTETTRLLLLESQSVHLINGIMVLPAKNKVKSYCNFYVDRVYDVYDEYK